MKYYLRAIIIIVSSIGSVLLYGMLDEHITHMNRKKDIMNVYNARAEILFTFKDMELNKRGTSFMLLAYHSGMTNVYTFTEDEDNSQLELSGDTVQFDFNVFEYKNKNDTTPLQLMNSLLTRMKSFHIDAFSNNFHHLGIGLELYFEDFYEMYYIPDTDCLHPGSKYILNTNKLDEHWYWRKLE
jgi:hypothetical protein